MKIVKIQTEILKELLNPDGKVVCWPSGDGHVTISPKSVVAYSLPVSSLRVDLGSIKTVQPLSDMLKEPAFAGVKLTPTDKYRNDGTAREYRADNDPEKPIYIDTKLLANFDRPELYMARYNPLGLVTVCEYNIEYDAEVVVGCVCPRRVDAE